MNEQLTWEQYAILLNLVNLLREAQAQNAITGEAVVDGIVGGEIKWSPNGIKIEIAS